MAVPTPIDTEPIDIGLAPNDGQGDPIRSGGEIINDNTLKLYNLSNKVQANFMQIFKHPNNGDIEIVEQNDVVNGIIGYLGELFFVETQYNSGNINDFGTLAGNFNDGSYITYKYRKLA